MVIAGAGGHGLEVRSVLIRLGISEFDIRFYDDDLSKIFSDKRPGLIITDKNELREELIRDSRFVLGVGNPEYRERLYHLFRNNGGSLFSVSSGEDLSENKGGAVDMMPFSFLGPETKTGTGILINTRAQVHHECQVGDFTEIGPAAILLGAAKVGKKCRIGAGAVILPGVELGDEVVVGAGAVVTKSIGAHEKVAGIPARPIG